MPKIKAIVSYVKIDALVEVIQPAMKIVAEVRPRIRAFVDFVNVVALVKESSSVVTYSKWDDGSTNWDVVGGVTLTRWDIDTR